MTSSKHTSARGYKRNVRLTTFITPNLRQNGCLKRDRQLVSSGPLLTQRTRKDAAVHVSLSSDEIVKQRSEDKSPRPPQPALRIAQRQTRKAQPKLFNAPGSRPRHQLTNSLPTPPLREVQKAVDQGHNKPTRQSSGVAVGEALSKGTPDSCQTVFKNIFAPRTRRPPQSQILQVRQSDSGKRLANRRASR